MACCTGHRKNKYFEKISLAPKLCEIHCIYSNYFTETIFKLSPTYHRRSKCNCRIYIVVSELVANLNISESKRVVRDIQIVLYRTL